MKMLKLYEALLKTAGFVVTEDNYVSRLLPNGKRDPATIKGKRMVLPTPEHLANPNDRILFHPLSENILRGESAVLEEFRSSLNIKLNVTIGLIAYQLLTIATSPGMHARLSPDQSEFLSKVKNADEKTLENFRKLMKAMDLTQSQKAFVGIYLKRGGMVNGKKHSRVGVVSFPLYDEVCKPDRTVYGVNLRAKDVEALKSLFEYMIPKIDTAAAHNRGSDSDVAPYLDSLMKAFISVAGPLNDLVDLFHNQLDDPTSTNEEDPSVSETLRFNDEWVEVFDNLSVMVPEIRMIPMQAGNEGTSSAVANQPVTTSPASTTTAGSAPASPLPAALSQPMGWVPPQQQQNQWGQPQQATPPGVVKTARGGLDFDSVLRNNPALGGGFNTGFGGQQQQQRAGFSQPQQQGGWNNQQQFGGGQQWSQPQQQFGNQGVRTAGL